MLPENSAVCLPPENQSAKPIDFMDSASFDQARFTCHWLIESILVAGQPGVIGGPKKSLKTSLLLDMAISLATGTSFLGHFHVPQPAQVAVLSGESAPATLQESARRICAARKLRLDATNILWSFQLPRLTAPEDLQALACGLRQSRVEVVFIDPLYLCLLGKGHSISATNLYEVGPLLQGFAASCLDAGATPILVHHKTKTGSKKTGPLDLDDLAFAGTGEFARQWVLLSRRQPYQSGSGAHALLLVAGGSAGHSSTWDVDISEGLPGDDLTGRKWKVKVRDHSSTKPAASHAGKLPLRPGAITISRKKPTDSALDQEEKTS